MDTKPLFSSARHDWETPDYVFDYLNEIYDFTLDGAANDTNSKLSRYIGPLEDTLKKSWANERVWLNPPYGREQKNFVQKAYYEVEEGNCELAVVLIPARPDTKLWHDIIFKHAAVICFLKGRIKFVGASSSAPFPSAIIVFRKHTEQLITSLEIPKPI